MKSKTGTTGSQKMSVPIGGALTQNGNQWLPTTRERIQAYLTAMRERSSEQMPGVDYARLAEIGNRDSRLAKFVERLQRGGWLYGRDLAIYELCQNQGVSFRTAHRHLKAGTTPATQRKIGRDGKSYPDRRSARRSRVQASLKAAQRALKRAIGHAESDGWREADTVLLGEILDCSMAALAKWKGRP